MADTTKSNPVKPINIREVFREKNERISRLVPGFIYRYLHRILHIDFINDLLKKYGQLKGIEFVDEVVKEFNIQEFIHGQENIPPEGKFIFASNHPLGGFDGLLLMKNVEKRLGSFKFLANDILLNIPQLSPVFVPVNKHGGHAREAAKMLSGVYESNNQVLIFPSGLASRKIKGQIIDLEWKKHFISKAIEHKRDIIPVFISGRNTNRFYRLAKLRKLLKIKWNLEMFFLPDETYRHRNTDVHLYFGKPIPYSTFDSTKTHKDWAEWVKQQVYQLPETFG
ncbi:MAG: 1-acyl-sn-glycerol-3-phosphate acyltransferase [Draconibacterium sp.]